ncbi:ABC transporter substrate-binding protein [Polymorphum gilvum]|uniref:ABC transporter, substrate binding protein (Agrocinopine) n=1 Tax=Polymorphum gilvum (strain LMG 25793 / CGMCC 1.9160 / SL003B-26A1) TaxID=991905 RepID=F2IYY6_POLGS|nr:ABC transporter substrate-binding protein [Polymorphum gilvum]ADZ70601.1 ABC transporter, substrate binding protein (Agrocinopine) [Polymorphum gilvum SL003B-26A1]
MKKLLATTALASVLATGAFSAELTVGAANVSSYLDPGRDHSNVGSQFYYNVFDTLIGRNHDTTETEWVPALATSWTLIEPTVMELKLREGVTFHNGEAMTADDVVFSLNRMFQAEFPPYQVRSRDRLNNFDRAEKVDDYTVRVHAKRAEPLWETLLNLQQVMIVPEDYTKSLAGDPNAIENDDYEAFSLKPVGTGPYRVAEFVPGERIVWERFDGFWGEKAPLDRVTVKHMPETASRITALKTGEADIVTNIAPDQLALIDSDPAIKAAGAPTALFHVMIMNQNHPKLKDARIRRALSLAIDRDTLNEALWLGKAVVPSTHTMEEFGQLYMPELTTFEYDPEQAKALLKEAGYDGFEITFDTAAGYYTNGLLAAQAIMEMWAEVGVKGKVNVGDKWTGNSPDLMVRNWSNPMYFADPFGSFGVMWAPGGPSQSEGRFNTDADYAEIWDRFRFSGDVELRRAAYAELMEKIKNDPPVLPLYRPYESWAMKAGIDWAPKPGHIPYVLDFRAGSISFN